MLLVLKALTSHTSRVEHHLADIVWRVTDVTLHSTWLYIISEQVLHASIVPLGPAMTG